MKKLILFLPLLICSGYLSAQQSQQGKSRSTFIKCASFHISKPLRELATQKIDNTVGEKDEAFNQHAGQRAHTGQKQNKRQTQPDPVVQHTAGNVLLDTPIVNVLGADCIHPDAGIAAGPNHVVQCVNRGNYNIYNKQGNLLLSTNLSALGDTGPPYDPIVMYDKFADRWVLANMSGTGSYGTTYLAIAVSTSPDPAGSYYVYYFNYGYVPDFEKLSVWTDGYYATYRNFSWNDTVCVGVFERNRMLKGDPNAGEILATLPFNLNYMYNYQVINQNSTFPGSPKILTCDGALPPYGTPNYLMYYTNVNMGDFSNSIMIYKLVTDTTLKTCTGSFVDSLATAPYNGFFGGYGNFYNIRAPGTYLYSLEGTFNYRAPYIRFTGYSSVVLSNTVNLGDSIAGIKWYELRQNDTSGKWSIYQQGTYGPKDTVSRWNGSIAMDVNGNIALEYNVTNSINLYPAIRYTGRLASDPLGQMTFKEQTVIGGNDDAGLWGDFSECDLDPDGITFWGTNEYAVSANHHTRVFSFRLTSPASVPAISQNQTELKAYQSGTDLQVIATGLPSNEKAVVNLFDIDGRQLASEWIVPQANHIETRLNISSLAKGIYLVRIGNISYQRVVKVAIN